LRRYVKAIIVSVIVVILSGIGSYVLANRNFNKVANESSKIKELTQILKKDDIKDKDTRETFKKMHEMANTKIVAEDGLIWGEIQPTEEEVSSLIQKVTNSNYEDKDKLLEILNRWKSGDFSNCVDEHNFMWKKLGGQVGKASKLREGVK
jgi:hypothetical protein